MFEIKIIGASYSEFVANVLAVAASVGGAPVPTETAGAQSATSKPGSSGSATTASSGSQGGKGSSQNATSKPSNAGKAADPTPPADDTPASETQGSSTPDQAKADGLTSQDVLKAVLAYAGETSKAQAEAILEKFNAKRVGELKPEDYQAVLDAIEEAKSASSLA